MSCGKILFIQDHALDGGLVGLVRISAGAEAAFPFGGLLVQDVALIGMGALHLAVFGEVEALLGAAVRFNLQFRHGGKLLCQNLFFGFFLCILVLAAGQEHGHVASIQFGLLVHGRHLSAIFCEFFQQALADVGMGHFPAAEADGDLHPVAVGQKALGVADLDIEIIDVDSRGHTHFFDLDDPLVFLCLLVPLGLLEAILAVIHELADGGDGVGGNLHQVQVGFAGLGHGLGQGHNPKLLPLGGDQAHFLVVNFLVDLMSRVSYDGRTSNS